MQMNLQSYPVRLGRLCGSQPIGTKTVLVPFFYALKMPFNSSPTMNPFSGVLLIYSS